MHGRTPNLLIFCNVNLEIRPGVSCGAPEGRTTEGRLPCVCFPFSLLVFTVFCLKRSVRTILSPSFLLTVARLYFWHPQRGALPPHLSVSVVEEKSDHTSTAHILRSAPNTILWRSLQKHAGTLRLCGPSKSYSSAVEVPARYVSHDKRKTSKRRREYMSGPTSLPLSTIISIRLRSGVQTKQHA